MVRFAIAAQLAAILVIASSLYYLLANNFYFYRWAGIDVAYTELLVGLAIRCTFFVFFVSGLLFLSWVYAFVQTVKKLVPSFSTSPVMAVLWFFVPGANLVVPYLTFNLAFKAMGRTTSPILMVWWGAAVLDYLSWL